MSSITFQPGDENWKKLRRLATQPIPGKHSALYWLNANILGKAPLIPMTPKAHLGMCLFAEGATGIPEIDSARVKLILVSRGIGKSSLITKALPILRILQDRNYAVGIANEIADLAKTFLGDIKAEFESNELLRALFPEVIPNFRETVWAADRIIVQRDKLNPTSPSVLATGVGGTVTGVHMNMWIVDDMLSQNAAEAAYRGNFSEIEATNRWFKRLQPLLKSPKRDAILFIGCIEENQPVLMADGTWKPIKDIKVGDLVWACKKDGSEGFKPRCVTGVWPQGYSDVVEIDVAGRQLVCTPDHPILQSVGRKDGVGRKWVNAFDLGSKIEVFEGMEESEPTEDLVLYWLLGFLFGDGWVTKTERSYTNKKGEKRSNGTTYSVFFAPGKDEKLNERAVLALERLFGGKMYKTSVGTMRMDNTEAGRRLEALGLEPGVGAKGKRIPEHVWRASAAAKRAFLRGFADADGHWKHDNYCTIEICNRELAEDIHKLAMTCFVRPSRITNRTRVIQAPNSTEPTSSTTYHVALNFLNRKEPLRKYKVKSKRHLNIQRPVYDLTVEDGECAFIVSGFVVGNTRWWEGDSYEEVIRYWGGNAPREEFIWTLKLPAYKHEFEGKIYDHPPDTQHIKLFRQGEIAVFKLPAIDEAGRPIFPERYDEEELQSLQAQDPVFFAGQYLLEPTAGAASEFNAEWLHYYEIEGTRIRYRDQLGKPNYVPIRDLHILVSVDPAFADRHTAARTAIPVIGTDGKNLFLLEDFAEHGMSEDDIAHKVLDFHFRYQPKKLFVETIVAQVAVANAIRRIFRDNGLPEPMIEEIKSHGGQKKVMRIYGLQSYFKRGQFHIHKSHTRFLHEYATFPRGQLRDLLDAISFQVEEWERIFRMGSAGQNPLLTPSGRQQADQAALARIQRAFKRRR